MQTHLALPQNALRKFAVQALYFWVLDWKPRGRKHSEGGYLGRGQLPVLFSSPRVVLFFSFLFPPNLHTVILRVLPALFPVLPGQEAEGLALQNRSAPWGPCLPGAPRGATALFPGSDGRRRARGRRGGALCEAPFAGASGPAAGSEGR